MAHDQPTDTGGPLPTQRCRITRNMAQSHPMAAGGPETLHRTTPTSTVCLHPLVHI